MTVGRKEAGPWSVEKSFGMEKKGPSFLFCFAELFCRIPCAPVTMFTTLLFVVIILTQLDGLGSPGTASLVAHQLDGLGGGTAFRQLDGVCGHVGGLLWVAVHAKEWKESHPLARKKRSHITSH